LAAVAENFRRARREAGLLLGLTAFVGCAGSGAPARTVAATPEVAGTLTGAATASAPTTTTPAAPAAAAPATTAWSGASTAPELEADRVAGKSWPLPERHEALATGRAVIAHHQCTRCHDIDGLPSAGRPFDCVKCHTFLDALVPGDPRYEKIAAEHGKDVIDRYIRNIVHLLRVPNLTAIARRVRPDWIAGFLAEPYDVRPLLDESMIRHNLAPEDIRAVVRYFAAVADAPDPYAPGFAPPPRPPSPDAARLALGKERFALLGCPSCHVLGNVDFGTGVDADFLATMKADALLAPNLRFVPERVRPDVLVDWIVDPAAVMPGTPMPKMAVTRDDAELVRDYLLFADAGKLPPPPADKPLMRLPAPVKRAVAYEEMKERVLGKVCVHCHMNEHEKDTGPGNRGGFGYPGKGLSFRTYERAMYGAEEKDGTRYSVFVPRKGEKLPRVLDVLLRRRVENRRDHVGPFADHARPHYATDALLGMPMGLPAMSDEEIGILRKWIEEGCPGPTRVSGKPGFTDGFLVPDGPVPLNKGCELRKPTDEPLPWRSAPPYLPVHMPGGTAAPAAAPAPAAAR
jgi:cytochrome c2